VRRAIARVAPFVLAGLALGGCSDERSRPDAGPTVVSVHPAGILDPASDAFHGRDLRRRNWDFSVCARCHGDDFTGGAAQVSCLSCHTGGPTACTTCHGAGPTSNAHVVHRDVADLACSECHIVPARWDDEGHILSKGVAITGPANVTFGTRAGFTADPDDRKGPPTWQDGRCSNVYCHGDALHAAGGVAPEPRWDDPSPAGACNRCHGAPPPNHAQSRCETCHPSSAPHIDGIVQVGSGGCSGCHGDATSPAPPNDLSGNRLTTAIGVGAHRVHLDVPSRLRGPIACSACHLVPAQVGDPGHIDSQAPAEVNASLGWDRTAQTCETALCHIAARPVWTQIGGATCGSCHGVPPATPAHRGVASSITSCVTCHPQTVDATGTILLTAGPGATVTSKHINGVVDVF
jgi:predicted CxxxxCH...CXXCH cytochrome family protein